MFINDAFIDLPAIGTHQIHICFHIEIWFPAAQFKMISIKLVVFSGDIIDIMWI